MFNLLIYASLYAIFNVLGVVIIKNKLVTTDVSKLSDLFYFLIDLKIAFAFLIIGISFLLAIKTLSLANFSTAAPIMTALNITLTVSVGIIYFKDILAIGGYLGLLLVILGVVLIGKNLA